MIQDQDNLYSSDIQLLELLVNDQKNNPDSLLKTWSIGYPKKDVVHNNAWSIELGFSNSNFKSKSTHGLVYESITTLKFSTKVKDYKELKPLMDAGIKYVLKLVLDDEELRKKQPSLLSDNVEIKSYYDPSRRIVRFSFREDYDFNYSDEAIKVILEGYELEVE